MRYTAVPKRKQVATPLRKNFVEQRVSGTLGGRRRQSCESRCEKYGISMRGNSVRKTFIVTSSLFSILNVEKKSSAHRGQNLNLSTKHRTQQAMHKRETSPHATPNLKSFLDVEDGLHPRAHDDDRRPGQLREVGRDVEGLLAPPVHPAHPSRDEHPDPREGRQVGRSGDGGGAIGPLFGAATRQDKRNEAGMNRSIRWGRTGGQLPNKIQHARRTRPGDGNRAQLLTLGRRTIAPEGEGVTHLGDGDGEVASGALPRTRPCLRERLQLRRR